MANDKWKRMSQQAAVKAKQAATVALREADRLLKAARQRVESAARARPGCSGSSGPRSRRFDRTPW